LFFNGTDLKPDFNQKTTTGGVLTDLVSSLDGKMCVTIAESTIIGDEVKRKGDNRNHIYLSAIFHDAGYNVSENEDDNYIINSVNGSASGTLGNNARIWVNLGISKTDLNKSENWNQKPTKLYTYIKGAGRPTAPCLSESTRKIP
jgi:hypothetical protein